MSARDEFSQSSRSREDEHFRKKDVEWITKMQKQSELEIECRQMGKAIGVADQEILEESSRVGLHPGYGEAAVSGATGVHGMD